MKIGDRVTYDESVASPDPVGRVVQPTAEELEEAKEYETIGPNHGDIRVAWDDGARYWEHPSYLVLVREAGS